MKKVIFLVTSIDGLRKQNFIKQLGNLNNRNFEISILLAMTNFDEVWVAKKELSLLGKRYHLPEVEVITLTDIFGNRKGIDLTADDLKKIDLSKLEKRVSKNNKDIVERYINSEGDIIAESTLNKDGVPFDIKLYDDDNQLQQITSYDKDNHLFGIHKYVGGHLTETLLLNNEQKLIFRFILHDEPMRTMYSLANTSVLSIPQTILDEGVIDNSGGLINVDSQSDLVRREVINYTNYDRYYDINSFYREILNSLDYENARIYVDIEDVVDITTYLSNRTIFNY